MHAIELIIPLSKLTLENISWLRNISDFYIAVVVQVGIQAEHTKWER